MKTSTKVAMLIMAVFISIKGFPQWVTDTLSQGLEEYKFTPHSMYASKQGTIHFTYKGTIDEWEHFNIYYMSKDCSEDWSAKESVLVEGIIGNFPAITADKDNQPYIAFQKINETGSKIAITWKMFGTWRWEEVYGGLLENESPDIAIDGDGNIHLAWVGTTEDYWISLCYANNIGGVWNTMVIEEAILGQFGWDATPDIEVTTDGTAYIFYNGGDPGESYQYLATNSQPGGTTWKTERIYTENVNDFDGGIEIYNDEIIHAIVNGDGGFGFPSTLIHTFKTIEGDWSVPDTVNKSFPGTFMGMGVDNQGIVHASYMKDEWNLVGDFYIADNSTGIFRDSLLLTNLGEIHNAITTTDIVGNAHAIYYKSFDLINYSLLAMREGECLPTAIHAPEVSNSLVNVYPNPVSGSATLTVDQALDGFAGINLYDGSGKLVKTIFEGNLPKGSHQITVRFNQLPKGLYLLRLQNENGVILKKIIHQ